MRQKTIFNAKSQQNQSHSSVSQLRFILHAKVLTGKTMHMCFLRCSTLFPVGVPEILILYRHLWSQTAGIKICVGFEWPSTKSQKTLSVGYSKVWLRGANRPWGIQRVVDVWQGFVEVANNVATSASLSNLARSGGMGEINLHVAYYCVFTVSNSYDTLI